jgi:hypothetical protein
MNWGFFDVKKSGFACDRQYAATGHRQTEIGPPERASLEK